jgi:hypothetical protein
MQAQQFSLNKIENKNDNSISKNQAEGILATATSEFGH